MRTAIILLVHLAACLCAENDRKHLSTAPPAYDAAVDNGTYGYYPIHTYASANNLASPQTNFLQWNERCNDGLSYFITPRGWATAIPGPGPMILDAFGQLVWMEHFNDGNGGQAYDLMVQKYRGEDYLTFWLGDDLIRGHGTGSYYMLNSSYELVRKVDAGNGLSADLHEFLITPENTALMTMYQVVGHDLTALRMFNPDDPDDQLPNHIWDCVFHELSIETSTVMFQWRASDHINITDSYHDIGRSGTAADPYDYFHINSVAKDDLGNYLVSARYTHSIMYINGLTGDVIWTLGGKRNDFMDLGDGLAINFAWQHDARFQSSSLFPKLYTPPVERAGYTTRLLTLFDNAAEDQHYDYGLEFSRGLLLELTYPTPGNMSHSSAIVDEDKSLQARDNELDMNAAKVHKINGSSIEYTVRVITSYENPQHVRSSSQGSVQVIPQHGEDAKVFIGYGLNAVFTEFDANGSTLCDVHYGAKTSWERGDIQSYRAYKFAWNGRPRTPPRVALSDDDVEVYVSWNGATEVRQWVLQCSRTDRPGAEEWTDVVTAEKRGFETVILLPVDTLGDARYLRILAIDVNGTFLDHGMSPTIDRGRVSPNLASLGDHLRPLTSSVTSLAPLRVYVILACGTMAAFLLYEVVRRYLCWRHGRPSVGPLRWRKGPIYRIISEERMYSAPSAA